jgi:hypothetical protein
MTGACNHHLWSVRRVLRPVQRRMVDHHPVMPVIRHPSSGSKQPGCGMGIGIWRPTGVETTSIQQRLHCWSPFVLGLTQDVSPPPTPTIGIGGLPRSCTRTGHVDSMARYPQVATTLRVVRLSASVGG